MVNTEIRLIILFAAKDGEALHGQQKTRPGADCGSEHELLINKFRLKLKKVGKTIRPFRYGLNKISYDYTVEKAMATHSSTLACKIPRTEEAGRLQCMGSRRVGHD